MGGKYTGWKLVDCETGTFVYEGEKPWDGVITIDFVRNNREFDVIQSQETVNDD